MVGCRGGGAHPRQKGMDGGTGKSGSAESAEQAEKGRRAGEETAGRGDEEALLDRGEAAEKTGELRGPEEEVGERRVSECARGKA